MNWYDDWHDPFDPTPDPIAARDMAAAFALLGEPQQCLIAAHVLHGQPVKGARRELDDALMRLRRLYTAQWIGRAS